jgi:hypothetical protein
VATRRLLIALWIDQVDDGVSAGGGGAILSRMFTGC